MFHLILYQPEIPPNTGNIIRLCANTGTALHLIQPLGFTLDDKKLKRAGLDYQEFAAVQVYADLDSCLNKINIHQLYACTTKSSKIYTHISYQPGDAFLLGPETRGLPDNLLEKYQRIRIPMVENSRSLNLSNTAAVMIYEALRQTGSLSNPVIRMAGENA